MRCGAAIVIALGLACLAPLCALADTRVSATDLRFSPAGEAEFRDGQALLSREPLEWESDTAWRLYVESLDLSLGLSRDGRYEKGLADLQFRVSGDSQWWSLRTEPVFVAAGDAPGRGTLIVDWRMLLSWARDRPGTYRARLRFTIEQP